MEEIVGTSEFSNGICSFFDVSSLCFVIVLASGLIGELNENSSSLFSWGEVSKSICGGAVVYRVGSITGIVTTSGGFCCSASGRKWSVGLVTGFINKEDSKEPGINCDCEVRGGPA